MLTLCDPWTVVNQAPLSVGFPRQECWSGLPFSSLEDLPNPGIKQRSLVLQAISCIAGGFFMDRDTRKDIFIDYNNSEF